jgi:acyl-CoA synthetase (AMP-forming)/AMP-acid ligase II/outer membrane protein assembly factor BamB
MQFNSASYAASLPLRTRKGEFVLIGCEGNTGAEVVSMLASMRLGTVFIPIETTIFRHFYEDNSAGDYAASLKKLKFMVEKVKPSAAILVGENDNDIILKLFNSLGIYKCALLDARGNLVEEDASVTSGLVGSLTDFNPSEGLSSSTDIPSRPLYILHTSGSTGESKGVIGTYRGLVNRIAWQLDQFPYSFGEVTVRRTPLTFVDSLAEIFCPLLAGIPIVSQYYQEINNEGLLSILSVISLLGITRITLIPSQLYSFLKNNEYFNNDRGLDEVWPSLKYVIISGEECPIALIDLFQSKCSYCTLINIYGSTEVSGDITWCVLHSPSNQENDSKVEASSLPEIVKDKKVCIGNAIEGNTLLVVNYNKATESVELLPDDEVGELFVVGHHVANGYYSSEDQDNNLNKHRFSANPFLHFPFSSLNHLDSLSIEILKQEKYGFLTGDLVYRNKVNHCFYYVGRKDRQIKIRGNRIELEEIERTFREILKVDNDLVVLYLTANDLSAEIIHESSSSMKYNQLSYLVLVIDKHLVMKIFAVININNDDDGEMNVTSEEYDPEDRENKVLTMKIKKYLYHHTSSLFLPDFIYFYDLEKYRTSSYKLNRQLLMNEVKEQVKSQFHNKDSIVSISDSSDGNNDCGDDSYTTIDKILSKVFSMFRESFSSSTFFTYSHQSITSSSSSQERSISAFSSLPSVTNAIKNFNYYELGGNSISSIEMCWKLKNTFSLKYFHSFHLQLTINELAKFIFNEMHNNDNNDNDVNKDNSDEQQRPLKKMKHELKNNVMVNNLPKTMVSEKVTERIISSINRNGIIQRNHDDVNDASDSRITSSNKMGLTSFSLSWKYPLIKCIDATPVVGLTSALSSSSTSSLSSMKHITIIGSHGGDVVCLNVQTGFCYWKTFLYEHVESSVVLSLRYQTVFVSSFLGNDVDGFQTHHPNKLEDETETGLGNIRCLSVENGKILWKFSTLGECKQSVYLDEERNRLFGGCYNGIIYMLNIIDGHCIDKIEVTGSIYANFILCNEGCYLYCVTTRGSVYLLDVSRMDGNGMSILFEFNYDFVPIFSTPILLPFDNKMNSKGKDFSSSLVIPFVNGEIICLKINKGESIDGSSEMNEVETMEFQSGILWQQQFSLGSFFSSMTVFPSVEKTEKNNTLIGVIGCHDGILRFINLFSGELMKEMNFESVLYASPFISFSHKNLELNRARCGITIAVATTAGEVIAVTFDSLTDFLLEEETVMGGEAQECYKIIRTRLPAEIFSSPVVYDGKLLIGCRDDNIYCFQFV